ncbi:MAG: DNA polymerase III subunit beta [Proteobacteria bacterium]|nr:DNA polymerase III subunit beta [Pseudomonadota bacterium]
MKISISHENLFRCLEYLISVIPATRVNPILSHVLIRAEDKKITMIGTDHEVQMTTNSPAETDGTFEQLVPADKLRRVLSTYSGDTLIKMDFSENEVKILAGRSTFNLMTQKADNFTLLGETSEIEELEEIPADTLLDAINKVNYATAQESHRRNLNGMFFQRNEEGINFVGTDGHRMAIKTIERTNAGTSDYIIPVRTVQILAKHISNSGNVKIAANDRVIRFTNERFELISNIIQEIYPDYQHVIPRNNSHQAIVERVEFKKSLDRVLALSDNNATANLEFDKNKLNITGNNTDNDRLLEVLEAKYSSEKITLELNAIYLTQFLNVCKEQMIEINMSTPENSVLFRPIEEEEKETVNYIVMPVRH